MKVQNKGRYLSALCIVTYTMAYLCRVNLSSAVVKMADGFGVPSARIGIFGTAQALIYALGQVLNGPIITRRKPGKVIAFAVTGTAVCNLLLGFTPSFVPALIIWALNAYLQSFLWGAVVRIVETYPESKSSNALMELMLCMPAGYILSWTVIAGCLDKIPDWHPYFLIPGAVILLTLPFWLTLGKTCPETEAIGDGKPSRGLKEVARYIHEKKVYPFLGISVLTGFIRESILFWAPVMITRVLSGSQLSPYIMAAIIPLARTPSSIVLAQILKRTQNHIRLIFILFVLVFALCAGSILLPGGSAVFFTILLAVLTFLICTIGSMMSLYVPLTYGVDDMSAPIAGILDAVLYCGASISTAILGQTAASDDPSGAVVFWAAAALLGILITFRKGTKKVSNQGIG